MRKYCSFWEMSTCSMTKLRSTVFLYRTLYFNKYKFIIYNLNATCMKWDSNLTFSPLYMHFPQVYALHNLSFPLGLWWFLCFYHLFAVIFHLGKKGCFEMKATEEKQIQKGRCLLPICLKTGRVFRKMIPFLFYEECCS